MAISKQLWSVENPKSAKAAAYGARNAILYLAPAGVAGVGNMCPHASNGCAAACLAMYSGQAAMVRNSDSADVRNNVRASRIEKTREFMTNRAAFMQALSIQLARQYRRAVNDGFSLIARPNGGTDIGFEGVGISVDPVLAAKLSDVSGMPIAPGRYASLFALFPFVRFNDYTKNHIRMRRFLDGKMPSNYHLTFSRSEANAWEVQDIITRGGNVAVVFDHRPETWRGVPVIDGDAHDLRCTDPAGVIVGLTPKGRKAARDESGFVVRTIT
jgi:hypothetical protein